MSQAGRGSEVALPAGTAVSVKLADTIDSYHDSFGKQYAASVAAPIDIAGGTTIAAGSRATVVLIHNNSGWLTRLTALTVNGRKFDVASSAGTLILPGQSKGSADGGMFSRIGLAATSAPSPIVRVLFPPSTELRFLLIGSATPGRAVASAVRSRSAGARTERSLDVSPAVYQQETGVAYLCRARDRSDRLLPSSYYIADVFETSDNPAIVEKRWYQFLAATYPYRFANNPHATVHCMRLTDPAAERDARKQLEGELKSENAEVVQTRWHYILGPPPRQITSSAASSPER
jgi:hypothetical protein